MPGWRLCSKITGFLSCLVKAVSATLLLLLCFSSCEMFTFNEITEQESEQRSGNNDYLTLKVSPNFGGSSRAAYPEFSTTQLSSYVYKISSEAFTTSTGTFNTTDGTIEFLISCNPFENKTAEILVKDSTSGADLWSATATLSYSTVGSTVSKSFNFQRISSSTVAGLIDLSVSTTSGYSISCEIQNSLGTTVGSTEETDLPLSVDNSAGNTCTINTSASGIAAGDYKAIIKIYKGLDTDNIRDYKIQDIIVWPGITTDRWYLSTGKNNDYNLPINADEVKLYVKGTSPTGLYASGGLTATASSTNGATIKYPVDKLQYAIAKCKSSSTDYKIIVSGTAKGTTTIGSSVAAKTITLEGASETGNDILDGETGGTVLDIQTSADIILNNVRLINGSVNLPASKKLTVAGIVSPAGSDGIIATIKPESYTANTPVLQIASGVTDITLPEIAENFAVVPNPSDGKPWFIDEYGKLQPRPLVLSVDGTDYYLISDAVNAITNATGDISVVLNTGATATALGKAESTGTIAYAIANTAADSVSLSVASGVTVTLAEDSSGLFKNCQKLVSADLRGFDTSAVTNMAEMFYMCVGLASVDLSSFNTSNVTNMSRLFSGIYVGLNESGTLDVRYNTILTALDVSSFDTSNVTDMSFMFQYLKGLTSLDVSNFNTQNVTDMQLMFAGMSNITTLDLSNFNTASVTNMNQIFAECEKLTTLDISSFNTASVTDMRSMFLSCKLLASLDLHNFNTANVTTMSGMFNQCENLTTLDISSFNTSNVTDFGSMFNYCKKLTSLDLSHFDTSKATSFMTMFTHCEKLTSLNLSSFDTREVTSMADMFMSLTSYTGILDISSFDTNKVTSMKRMFNSSQFSKIIVSQDFVTTGITSSYDGALVFSLCTNLVGGAGTAFSDSFPKDITYARIDDPDNGNPGYFTEAPKVAKVGTRSCYSMEQAINAIKNASGTVSVVLYGTITGSQLGPAATSGTLLNAVQNTSATAINLSIAEGETIALPANSSNFFKDCGKLSNVDLRGLDTSSVTSMQSMFHNCAGIRTLDLSTFDTSHVTNMAAMFRECKGLNSLDLSSFDTSSLSAANSMFRNVCNATVIYVSESFVTTSLTGAGSCTDMFIMCNKLKGAANTAFNASHKSDVTYARIDGGPSAPGYFTAKVPANNIGLSAVSVSEAAVDGSSPVSGSKVFVSGRSLNLKSIEVSDHEVTQGEYETYCIYGGTNKPTAASGKGVFYPAYYVSWYDAIVYCNLRTIKEMGIDHCVYSIAGERNPANWDGKTAGEGSQTGKYCGPSTDNSTWNNMIFDTAADGWRLPTEAEWEFLAREGNLAGEQTTYSGSNEIDEVCYYKTNSGVKAHYVKQKEPNDLGLYDMSGNVWEYCWDFADSDNALADDTPITGITTSAAQRECRGGGYNSEDTNCPLNIRYKRAPYSRPSDVGFRVVRGALTSYVGTKAPSEEKEIGDIVFNDGSAMPYSLFAALASNEEKNRLKSYAVALIFYKGTGLNSGDDTTTERTLGVGLKHYKDPIVWCTNTAKASSVGIDAINCAPSGSIANYTFNDSCDKDGSDNLDQIAEALGKGTENDDTGTASNYPALYFAINYKVTATNVNRTVFEGGWYVPSAAELFQIYVNGKGDDKAFDLDTASEALGGDKFARAYLTSSQVASSVESVYVFNFNSKSFTYDDKISDMYYVCAIREF